MIQILTVTNKVKSVDISAAALSKFGVHSGERVDTPKGEGCVIGVCADGYLWFQIDSDSGASYWDNIVDAKTMLGRGIIKVSENTSEREKFGRDIYEKIKSSVVKDNETELQQVFSSLSTFQSLGVDISCFLEGSSGRFLFNLATINNSVKCTKLLVANDVFFGNAIFCALRISRYAIVLEILKSNPVNLTNNVKNLSLANVGKGELYFKAAQALSQFVDSIQYSDLSEKEWETFSNYFTSFFSRTFLSELSSEQVDQMKNAYGLFLIALVEKHIIGLNFVAAEKFFQEAENFWEGSNLTGYGEAFYKLGSAKMSLLNAAYEYGGASFSIEPASKDEEKKLFKNYAIEQVLPYLEKAKKGGSTNADTLMLRLKMDKYDLGIHAGEIDSNTKTTVLNLEVNELFDELSEDFPDPSIDSPVLKNAKSENTRSDHGSTFFFKEQSSTRVETKENTKDEDTLGPENKKQKRHN